MSHNTTKYEHLLDLPNVIGVNANPDGSVTALVSNKVPTYALDAGDHVSANVQGVTTDVEDMGFGYEVEGFVPEVLRPGDEELIARAQDRLLGRMRRQRPIPMGVSEMHHSGGAATGGYFPARVDDTKATEPANWSAQVSPGDYVRLSNNHVYATENSAAFETDIMQPSPLDYGDDNDVVGHMAGYVMLRDGATVDVAARSVNPLEEVALVYSLDDPTVPSEIYRGDYNALEGEQALKSGRTTGIKRAGVRHSSATLKVGYGGHLGAVRLRDQLVTDDMSNAGDSGAPVFMAAGTETAPRAFIGQLCAGGPNATIVNKATNIEREFGVELLDWSQAKEALTPDE